MSEQCPRVSIGVPVYNGERFLEETLESLLAQTFGDLEIIVSDNGSTDHTEELCRDYATRDRRIRYYRHNVNRGSAWNHNYVFGLSHGKYFKWNAADDVCAKDFVVSCVTALERDPSAVMACTHVREIDAAGRHVAVRRIPAEVEVGDPYLRFRRQIMLDHLCHHVYGVIRSHVLRKTDLIGKYADSDRVLLAHLCLFGRFALIQDPLFSSRDHPDRFSRTYADWRARMEWFDPANRDRKAFPFWRELGELWRVIGRSPLGLRDRLRCYRAVARWPPGYQRALIWELQFYPKKWITHHVPGGELAVGWVKTARTKASGVLTEAAQRSRGRLKQE